MRIRHSPEARAAALLTLPAPTKLLRNIQYDIRSKCWIWLTTQDKNGYPYVHYNGIRKYAHRASYEVFVGPIPEGMELDHLCRRRACINPAHLEPVTHAENTLRGNSPAAQAARVTRCKRGHELSFMPNKHLRICMECARVRNRAAYAAKRQQKEVVNGN